MQPTIYNNIVFLDFDGVLNSQKHFIDSHEYKKGLYKSLEFNVENLVKIQMVDIDKKKLLLVKLLCEETNSKIVVTSSWRNIKLYPYIEKILIEYGLPIVDKTDNINSIRGLEINNYLSTHKVDNYVILDDEIFKSFDELLLEHLVKTSFFEDGLTMNHVDKAIKLLRR